MKWLQSIGPVRWCRNGLWDETSAYCGQLGSREGSARRTVFNNPTDASTRWSTLVTAGTPCTPWWRTRRALTKPTCCAAVQRHRRCPTTRWLPRRRGRSCDASPSVPSATQGAARPELPSVELAGAQSTRAPGRGRLIGPPRGGPACTGTTNPGRREHDAIGTTRRRLDAGI